MKRKAKKTRSVPSILPREPMTKKAKAAIWCYIHHQAEVKMNGYPMAWLMFEATLKAERMRRGDLYTYLESKGYRWIAKSNRWKKKGQEE